MGRNKNLVAGVGINDADYSLRKTKSIDGKRREVWRCPFYAKWRSMLTRCYSKRLENKAYEDCFVCEDWKVFSSFKSWMEKQDWEGKELDKDILGNGTKIYGPESCAFVSKKVNMLVSVSRKEGQEPYGYRGKYSYVARFWNPDTGRQEYIGSYVTEEGARKAYLSKKHQAALKYSELEKDERVKKALKTFFAGQQQTGE